jgi:hypothetical protein
MIHGETTMEKKYDLGCCHLGNGLSVYNMGREVCGDYEKIALVD